MFSFEGVSFGDHFEHAVIGVEGAVGAMEIDTEPAALYRLSMKIKAVAVGER